MNNTEELRQTLENLLSDIETTKSILSDERQINDLRAKLEDVNRRQNEKFGRQPADAALYIAHGTHVTPDKFLTTEADGEQYCPIFAKETQNELTAIRDFETQHLPEKSQLENRQYENDSLENLQKALMEKRQEMNELSRRLQKALNIPPRLFGIPTKKDGQGNPVIDGNGAPVPQDGSYAYAIKKCAGIIKFTEDNEPVLIGTEDKYKRFENGENSGHIYVVDGKNFKPEYAANGSITEYTAQERPRLVNHINVSPKDAMEHNAQIIVFASDKLFDDWLKKARSKGGFNLQINKNSTVMASLAEEVRAGRAVYINATDRGMNPRISVLTDASQSFQKQTMIGAKFSELKTKLEQRKSINQSQQRTASAQTPQNNNDVFSQLKSQNTQE